MRIIDDVTKTNKFLLFQIGKEQAMANLKLADEIEEKYKDLEIPESLDSRFYEYLEKLELNQKRDQKRSRRNVFLKRAAILFLVLMTTLTTLTLTVEAFRTMFFNLIINTEDKYSTISFEESHDLNHIPEWSNYYHPTYLTSGYSLMEYSQEDDVKTMLFTNGQSVLSFTQSIDSTTMQLDTENSETRKIVLDNGTKAICTSKDNFSALIWSQDNLLFVLSGNLSEDELKKIANNLTFFK